MSGIQAFSGFPRQGLQLLAELGKNNSREWFEAHKGDRAQL
jgi:uncharacterized protein (DUF2461 family)